MLVEVLRFLRGSVTFSVKGSPERFYNQCAKGGIVLWNMQAGPEASAVIAASQYRRLRVYARRSGCCIRCREKKGLPFRLAFMRQRKGFSIGLFLSVCLVMFLSSRVWSIEVEGLNAIREEDFRAVCQETGLTIGMAKSDMNPHQMQQRIMQRFPEISWLTVNTSGSAVHIELTEGVEKPEMIDTEHVGNMTALMAGQVVRIEVFSGKAAVSVGEAVAPGQLLISGTVENGAVPLVKADGKIIAKTNRTFSATVSMKEEIQIFTGDQVFRKSLTFFGIPIPLTLTAAPSGEEWIREGDITVMRFNSRRLPLYWTEETWKKTSKNIRKRSREEAEKLAREKIEEQKKELSDLKILEQAEEFAIMGDTLYYTVTAKCEENIAVHSEIHVQ